MLRAVDYLARAVEMRRFAEDAPNPSAREQFLRLAAEYGKLAERAAARERQAHAARHAGGSGSPG